MISNNIILITTLVAWFLMITIVLDGCSHREQPTEDCCQAEFNFKQQKISSDKLFKKNF